MDSRPWDTSTIVVSHLWSVWLTTTYPVAFFFFHAYFFFLLTDMQATGRKADQSRHSHMVRTCQS